MATQARLVKLALSVIGPAVVPALRKAAADPRTREQLATLVGQIRSGVGDAGPAARARVKLRRDLDGTVELTLARQAGARDPEERALADGWVREAQDIRHAADIAGALGTQTRDVLARLEDRRQALLTRMLEATLPDDVVAGEEAPGDAGRARPQAPDAAGDAIGGDGAGDGTHDGTHDGTDDGTDRATDTGPALDVTGTPSPAER